MIVEDYTRVYFETIKGQITPAISYGKFVHITGPHGEFLLLAPTQFCKYHAHIVAHFCRTRDDVSFVLSGDDGRITTPGWTIRGGGKFRLDRTNHVLLLWGSSKAYGAFDGGAIVMSLRGAAGWGEYKVQLAEPS